MRQSVILIYLLAVMLWPAATQAQYTFTTNTDGSLNIKTYTGSNSVVTIPSTTNELAVTTIGTSAFRLCNTLTSITIPDSVTSIGTNAFMGCANLAVVEIGNGVITIKDNAFYVCDNLSSLKIGKSVASIGYQAFSTCYGLTNVIIPNSVTNIGDYAFNGDGPLPFGSLSGNLTNVILGTGVTTIGVFAFGQCNLTALTIPNSVISIGDGAFAGNEQMTSLRIGQAVVKIGSYAFNSCTSLINITIPKSATNIMSYAFDNCLGLSSVYFEGNAPPDNGTAFAFDPTTVYFLPGTTGWNTTFGSRPTVLWNPQAHTGDGSFGVLNNQFGFNITGCSNLVIVVEAATNLANPVWSPVTTNTLNTFVGTNGMSHFSDPQWTNYPNRFYRFRSP